MAVEAGVTHGGAAARLRRAADLVAGARRLVVFTGAGMSADSGVPTFRDAGGLWSQYRPEELAAPAAFRADPERVWRWYDWRRQRIRAAGLHAGYRALGTVLDRVPRAVVVTQNVDGFHEQAGHRPLIELHGNLWWVRCTGPGAHRYRLDDVPLRKVPPHCRVCRALLRPDVVWFGEALPDTAWMQAMAEAEACDLMLVVGTSAQVFPAALLPGRVLERGRPVIEVNPVATPLTRMGTLHLAGRAAEILPRLARELDRVLRGTA